MTKLCPLCLNEGREWIRDDEIMCNKHLFLNGRGAEIWRVKYENKG